MPQLDGMRALAAVLVIFGHIEWPHEQLAHYASLGRYLGVRLFFVLSGYLITRILLDLKERLDEKQLSLGQALGSFYLRRILRIFPLYYFTVLIVSILALGPAREAWPWTLTFTVNIFGIIDGSPGPIAHLWTLAIEEQFYLLWPLFLFLTPAQDYRKLLGVMIVVGLVFETLTEGLGLSKGWLLLPASFDAFGVGALLAINQRNGSKRYGIGGTAWRLGLLGVVCFIVAWLAGELGRPGLVTTLAHRSGTVLLLGAVIGLGANGIPGLIGRIIGSPVATAAGRISYGIYLWHMFVIYGLIRCGLFDRSLVGWTLIFFSAVALSVGLAAISWLLIERPVQRYRTRLHHGSPPEG